MTNVSIEQRSPQGLEWNNILDRTQEQIENDPYLSILAAKRKLQDIFTMHGNTPTVFDLTPEDWKKIDGAKKIVANSYNASNENEIWTINNDFFDVFYDTFKPTTRSNLSEDEKNEAYAEAYRTFHNDDIDSFIKEMPKILPISYCGRGHSMLYHGVDNDVSIDGRQREKRLSIEKYVDTLEKIRVEGLTPTTWDVSRSVHTTDDFSVLYVATKSESGYPLGPAGFVIETDAPLFGQSGHNPLLGESTAHLFYTNENVSTENSTLYVKDPESTIEQNEIEYRRELIQELERRNISFAILQEDKLVPYEL